MNVIDRHAIWDVHGKRCAYCREPLLFRDMELDHVIPRTIADHPEIWQATKRLHGLEDNFDIDSASNRLPACGTCNGRKLDTPFPQQLTQINLTKARYLLPQVEEKAAQIRRQQTTDRTRINLINEIRQGNLTDSDITRISLQARNDEGRFAVNGDGWFHADTPLVELSRADVDRYLDQAVNPNNDGGLELQNQAEVILIVNTLRKYREACALGFFALSNYSRNMEFLYFARPLALLAYLQVAQFAEQSYVSDPQRGLSDISLLPATLLFTTFDITEEGPDPRISLAGQSVLTLVRDGTAKILNVGSNFVQIEFGGWITFLLELMRADVNNDGFEEIVVHRGGGPVQGTHRTAEVLAIARTEPEAMFYAVENPC